MCTVSLVNKLLLLPPHLRKWFLNCTPNGVVFLVNALSSELDISPTRQFWREIKMQVRIDGGKNNNVRIYIIYLELWLRTYLMCGGGYGKNKKPTWHVDDVIELNCWQLHWMTWYFDHMGRLGWQDLMKKADQRPWCQSSSSHP